jgi:hypothetical protein
MRGPFASSNQPENNRITFHLEPKHCEVLGFSRPGIVAVNQGAIRVAHMREARAREQYGDAKVDAAATRTPDEVAEAVRRIIC